MNHDISTILSNVDQYSKEETRRITENILEEVQNVLNESQKHVDKVVNKFDVKLQEMNQLLSEIRKLEDLKVIIENIHSITATTSRELHENQHSLIGKIDEIVNLNKKAIDDMSTGIENIHRQNQEYKADILKNFDEVHMEEIKLLNNIKNSQEAAAQSDQELSLKIESEISSAKKNINGTLLNIDQQIKDYIHETADFIQAVISDISGMKAFNEKIDEKVVTYYNNSANRIESMDAAINRKLNRGLVIIMIINMLIFILCVVNSII